MATFFDLDRIDPAPWRNGGGATREVAVGSWDARVGFDWRVSVATITESGPFSPFPGLERTIMLLTGDGVHLTDSDGSLDHRLDRRWEPFDFCGDLAVHGAPLGATCTALNLLVDPLRAHGRIDVVRDVAATQGDVTVFLVLQGAWEVNGQGCPAGQGAWWVRGQAPRIVAGPTSVAAWIQVHRR